MKKVNFILGIHNHQPVGNFDFVFEDALKKAYLPFLEILKKFSFLKICLHNSGCLIEWLLKNHPEVLEEIKKLVNKGKIEIVSGGFYEPIFSLIPDKDKIGQINMMNKFIKDYFNYSPSGVWLPERIWEPNLPKIFNQTGIKYTIVDDTHFKSAGLKEEDMLGYFVTEEEGYKLNIFPISSKMRYFVPFGTPEDTINYLKTLATDEGNNLVVLFDDGEKFGIWPQTYEWVYEKKWLEKFFIELEKNSDWINITTFSEYISSFKPIGRIYLPTASYDEMLEWAMPADSILEYEDFVRNLMNCNIYEKYKRFVKGGFFRNFLTKYSESNNMHKKMLLVSEKINKLNEEGKDVKHCLRILWSGQCNCAYWHGVFGGLYLNHLRFAVYTNLIKAEFLADEIRFGRKEWLEYNTFDFDRDNSDEILINSNLYNIYIDPARGGSIFEFDYKPRCFNLLDTLSRRKEAYHKDLFKGNDQSTLHDIKSVHELVREFDKDIKKDLIYDRYRRVSLIDHFLTIDSKIIEFTDLSYKELGDFVSREYKHKMKGNEVEVLVDLERMGIVEGNACKVIKSIYIKSNDPEIIITYEISNLSEKEIYAKFGVEFNFSMLGGDSSDRHYYVNDKKLEDPRLISLGEESNVDEVGIIDNWLKIKVSLSFSEKTTVWRFPIQTISQSIGKLEKVYQSSVIFPNWTLKLSPKEVKKITIKKRVENVN
ncbi:MAG: alpha-amylase/4-alpha-glucanotransferase domain-containing protein [Candidatus Firestonebacteria bacterium]